jgi:hypothetical protein
VKLPSPILPVNAVQIVDAPALGSLLDFLLPWQCVGCGDRFAMPVELQHHKCKGDRRAEKDSIGE